jgi:predicted AlkP superfamily pyrophosphatase or phosphodiesterase
MKFLTYLLLLCGVPAVALAQAKPHVLVISIDGMRPDYVTHADEHHLKIPTLRRFMAEGTYADGVQGVYPTVTYPSHTTIITGAWPAQHGIFANTKFEPAKAARDEWYVNFSEIKVETLWQAAKQTGLTTASISWPVTVGSPWIDYNIAEYAQSEDIGDKETKNSDTPPGLMNEMTAAVPAGADEDERKTIWAIGVIQKYKPNFMTVHVGITDHEQHAHGPFSSEADAAVEAEDGRVARLMAAELANDPNATIIVTSDHGFVSTNMSVNIPALLVQNGLIKLENPTAKSSHPAITSWDANVWETGGSCAIILRDPNDKALYDKVLAVLTKAQADPTLGIKRIVQHDDIVKHGGNPGASFMIDFKPGFKTGRKFTGNILVPSPDTGTHGNLPDGEPQVRSSFFAIGKLIAHGKDLGVIDQRQLAPTIAKLLGVSLPEAKQPALPIRR